MAPNLRSLAPEAMCLMDVPRSGELRAALPHLVSLRDDGGLLPWWRAHGAGKAWGIAMRTHADITVLRRHLKKFMFAYLPDDTRVLFRFWDPRVLSAYMPLCDSEAREAFMGPMTALYLEDWKTGKSMTLRPVPGVERVMARPSRFFRPNAGQVDRLTCTSFLHATYERLISVEGATPFQEALRSHRSDLLSFWEGLWPQVALLAPETAAPALAYAAALRLRNGDVAAGLAAALSGEAPSYTMKAELTAWGYLPFSAFYTLAWA